MDLELRAAMRVERYVRSLMLLAVLGFLTGCSQASTEHFAALSSAANLDSVDVVYRNGKSIGVEYVTGYDAAASEFLTKACNGSFRILNRTERDTRTDLDALCI